MTSEGAWSFSAGPFGDAPRNTRRSIVPGSERIDASPTAHTGANHCYGLRDGLTQVAYRSQNVQVQRGAHGSGLAWPS